MRRNTLVFMIIAVIFVVAAAIVFPLENGMISGRPVQLGLDLEGGVHLLYEADLSDVAPEDQDAAMDARCNVNYSEN
jgi:preprotein translocase subunit SecD